MPSQVKVSHLEIDSKLRDPKPESEIGLPPTGGWLKNGSRYPLPFTCQNKDGAHDNNIVSTHL